MAAALSSIGSIRPISAPVTEIIICDGETFNIVAREFYRMIVTVEDHKKAWGDAVGSANLQSAQRKVDCLYDKLTDAARDNPAYNEPLVIPDHRYDVFNPSTLYRHIAENTHKLTFWKLKEEYEQLALDMELPESTISMPEKVDLYQKLKEMHRAMEKEAHAYPELERALPGHYVNPAFEPPNISMQAILALKNHY